MRPQCVYISVVDVLILLEVAVYGLTMPGRHVTYRNRLLRADGEGSTGEEAGPRPRRPAGIPHMWSERQHKQRVHENDHVADANEDPERAPDKEDGKDVLTEKPDKADHLYGFLTDRTGRKGSPQNAGDGVEDKKYLSLKQRLHRTGLNDILKGPGMDPEITGDANNLNLLSVMKLANMNLSDLIPEGESIRTINERQLRKKLREKLFSEVRRGGGGKGSTASRYSLVTTRVRTRAKRSDSDMGDDYTWAVIVGGSGLAILVIVMCACICARCNVDRKNTSAPLPLPTDNTATIPAVFFVGGNSAPESGLDNSAFAMGDLPPPGTEAGAVGGVGTGFAYSALKEDDDTLSMKSAPMEMEKS